MRCAQLSCKDRQLHAGTVRPAFDASCMPYCKVHARLTVGLGSGGAAPSPDSRWRATDLMRICTADRLTNMLFRSS